MKSADNIATIFPRRTFLGRRSPQLDVQEDKDLVSPGYFMQLLSISFSEGISRLKHYLSLQKLLMKLNLQENVSAIKYADWWLNATTSSTFLDTNDCCFYTPV